MLPDTLLERYPDGLAKKFTGRLQREVQRAWEKVKIDDGPSTAKPWVRAPIHDWINQSPPHPEYTVQGRILTEQVCLFSGEGGTGKSTMAQHLCSCHVTALNWMGCQVCQGPAIHVECEDTEKALNWRQVSIADYLGVPMQDFVKNLHLFSLVEQDTILGYTDKRGVVQPTGVYKLLYEMAGDIKPVLISIASLANIFAGNEIDRTQVQQFIKLLSRIPLLTKGSLVLVSQPSLTGIGSTNISHKGLSGTTQWHNAVRCRAAVEHIKPKGEEENCLVDTGLRSLTFYKNQYGPPAPPCMLHWQNGLFVPMDNMAKKTADERAVLAEDLTIKLLKQFAAQNRNVSINPNPLNYAPKLFAETAEATTQAITERDFKMAIDRLLNQNIIVHEAFHHPGRSKNDIRYRLVIKGIQQEFDL
jgi:RecA-family ATPase